MPIEIIFNKENTDPNFRIIKKWKWSPILDSKKVQIIAYVAGQIKFTYIPAVRTEEDAMSIISEMISDQLSQIENDLSFILAISEIKKLQQPILDNISTLVKNSISSLLPNIKSVQTIVSEDNIRMSTRYRPELFIDDWTKTKLEYKWDWVKSLVALSLLKDSKKDNRFSLIAIEEPESHLHPWAIRPLKEAIYSLRENNQVVISTHNWLFVDKQKISSNIIVDSWHAESAKNIKDIRDILWIQQADNLTNASHVLVVEWLEDKTALSAIFKNKSTIINKAMDANTFAIDHTSGTGNLSYKLSLLETNICNYHVLLDNDSAWKVAFEKAKIQNNLSEKNTTFSIMPDMTESEFEDCLNEDVYASMILQEYGVDIKNISTKKSKRLKKKDKRSQRMKTIFQGQWKQWDEKIKCAVKNIVAKAIIAKPENAVITTATWIDALIKTLEENIVQ